MTKTKTKTKTEKISNKNSPLDILNLNYSKVQSKITILNGIKSRNIYIIYQSIKMK